MTHFVGDEAREPACIEVADVGDAGQALLPLTAGGWSTAPEADGRSHGRPHAVRLTMVRSLRKLGLLLLMA